MQDVATQSALQVYADPRFASNTELQRSLRKTVGIKKTTTVQYRDPGGAKTAMPLVQAMAKQKADNQRTMSAKSVAGAKASFRGKSEETAMASTTSVAASKKSSYVPENKNFIANKNKGYTPPPAPLVIPNSSNRKTRNELSDTPLEFYRGASTHSKSDDSDGDFARAVAESRYRNYFASIVLSLK